jgi:hypothetical protein
VPDRLDRLEQEVGDARLPGLVAVGVPPVAGHGDEQHMPQAGLAPQPPGQLPASMPPQAEVQEGHVGPLVQCDGH